MTSKVWENEFKHLMINCDYILFRYFQVHLHLLENSFNFHGHISDKFSSTPLKFLKNYFELLDNIFQDISVSSCVCVLQFVSYEFVACVGV